MPNQNARRAISLSTVALSILLPCILLSTPSVHAQAKTQPPPAEPATAAAPPAASAPSAAVAAVIAVAKAKVKAGQCAEAVAALTAAKTDGLPPDDKKALDFAIADAHQAWGIQLINANQSADAIAHLESALLIDAAAATRRAQNATDLRGEGVAYSYMSQFEKSITYYEQALAIYREVKDSDGQAKALGSLGIAYDDLSQYAKAIIYFEQALPIFQTVKDRNGEATALGSLGTAYESLSQSAKAIGYYEQALPIYREVKDRNGEANVLGSLGNAYRDLSQYAKAIGYHEQALPIYREVKNRIGEAVTLGNLGNAYLNMSQYAKAIGYYEQALPILRAVKDRNDEANALNAMGNAYLDLSQYEKAIAYFRQALSIFQTVRNRSFEASSLANLGNAYLDLSQYEKAIGYYEQAVTICREINNRNGEAAALTNLGNAFSDLSQNEKAIGYYEKALTTYREIKDRNDEAIALTNMGTAYLALSQYAKAIANFELALTIFQMVKDRDGEAGALTNLGLAYRDLSQNEKAIGYYEKALTTYRAVKDRNDEAIALTNLGTAFSDLNQYTKAITYFKQALTINREVKDRNGEAIALTGLGGAYNGVSQYPQAIAYFEQALMIFRVVKDKDYEGYALINLGFAYGALSQYAKAIAYFEQALSILREVKDRSGEAIALDDLETVWATYNNPNRSTSLAILFGKQAVNILQSIRSDIHEMDKRTQQGFAKSKAKSYRTLADLLVEQHRLPEAMQILDLLKQEEYLNFSKPEPGKANSAASLLAKYVDLTPRESRWNEALDGAGGALARNEALQDELARQKEPAPQQKERLAQISAKVAADNIRYQKILADLSADFRHRPNPVQDRLQRTSNVRDLQAALRTLGQGSVALYTLVTDENIRLLLVTPNRLVAKSVPLTSPADIDRKIAAFRDVLQDPFSDSRPLGKQLYDRLIAPIQRDLDHAHAQTLLVSLDGNLRYIPLAALSPDGKHYLVEKYRTALYTPAALASLTRASKAEWTALAMGVAKPPAGFEPLPAVPDELKSVARVAGETGSGAGEFPGVRLLDAGFTKSAMLADIGHGYPLVHIASHFAFTGDETTSFLLLGDGSKLTLSDLKALPEGLFSGVDLLTLSACETATGSMNPDANNGGRDVENVAVLAQRKGAAAVLASLWSVNDASTGLLMRDFYRDRKEAGATKAEALRQAQMALLTGSTSRPSGKQVAKRSDLLTSAPRPHAKVADMPPAFVPNPRAPWAHPFYWAPFILIGNWK